MIKYQNFSNRPVTYLEDTEFFRCNFSMYEPIETSDGFVGHKMKVGDGEGLVFINCNFTNREPPPKAKLYDCGTVIIQHYVVKSEEAIMIDSVKVGGKKEFVHRKHGYFEDGEYVYYSEPIEHRATNREI